MQPSIADRPKITIEQIALEAGVSRSTVDRVLRDRAGVREKTRQRVLSAQARLSEGSGGAPSSSEHSRKPLLVDAVIPSNESGFILTLRQKLQQEAMKVDGIRMRLHGFQSEGTDGLVSALRAIPSDCQALLLNGFDHPLVRQELIRLAEAGVKLYTIVTDIHSVPKVGYVGIDNRSSGRLAGHLLSKMLPPERKQIVLIHGPISYRCQEEREMGFRHILGEYGKLEIVKVIETQQDKQADYLEMAKALKEFPNAAGIYNTSDGNRAMAQALKESGREKDVVFIGHDLTNYTKQMLLDGTMDIVIDQNPGEQVRIAMEQLSRSTIGETWSAEPINSVIISAENIPELS